MTKTLASSTPVGRALHARRCSIRVSALARKASVTAICAAINIAPNLLRRMAESIGCMPMVFLLSFELPRRQDMRRPPSWVQAGRHGRGDAEQNGDGNVRSVKMRQCNEVLGQQRARGQETQPCERKPEYAAGKSDDSGLDEALRKNRAATCPERAAHTDVARSPHDLRQHQSHRKQQAQKEKSVRNPRPKVDFAWTDMPIPQPLHHVAQLRMRRPIEAAHTPLLGRIVV